MAHEWELEVHSPLAVQAAKTDCGCTLAELERDGAGGRAPYVLGAPLERGERLHVRVRYDTRGRRGLAQRSVTLTTTASEVIPLTLSAEVRPWLVTQPEELAFTRLLEGAGARCEFVVRAESEVSFGLSATRLALPDWVVLTLTPEHLDGAGRARTWRVAVELLPSIPRGTFSYPLELSSDVPIPTGAEQAAPRFFGVTPSWTVQVLGPVALSSPALEFGLVDPGTTVARSLRLENHDPQFELTQVEAELVPLHVGQALPLLKTATVHVRTTGKEREIELVLAGLDPAVQGNFFAKLAIDTGHPRLPKLEALVRGVAAPTKGGR